MTQMPLWGEPDEDPWKAQGSTKKVIITKHTGLPATCHLCILDVSHGTIRYERDLASHVAKGYGRVWLMCRNHTRDVREREALLERYQR